MKNVIIYTFLNGIIEYKENICIEHYLPLLPDFLFLHGLLFLIILQLFRSVNIIFLLRYTLIITCITFILLCDVYLKLNTGFFLEYITNNNMNYMSGNYIINTNIIIFKLITIFFFFILILIKLFLFRSLNNFNNQFLILYIFIFTISIFSILTFISANNFILSYISLELFSLCSSIFIIYNFELNIFLQLKKKFNTTIILSLNYLITSTLGSCIFLLGVSYIYGYCHTLNFYELYIFILMENFNLVSLNVEQISLILSFCFMILGLLIKGGFAPFHLWVFEIYKRLPYLILLYFFLLSKFIIIIFFYKIGFIFYNMIFLIIILITGLVNILFGSIIVIKEYDLKKILIGSSLNNVGYILILLPLLDDTNFFTLPLFISLYFLNVIGCLYILILNPYITQISTLYYIPNNQKPLFYLFFLSLLNIPFLSGFWNKLLILLIYSETSFILFDNSFFNYSMYLFIFLLLLISCLSLYYYLHIITNIIFNPELKNNKISIIDQIEYLFLYKFYKDIYTYLLKQKNIKLFIINEYFNLIFLYILSFLNLFIMLLIIIY